MVSLNFTISPESCVRLFDSLTCLAKFSDTVTIEARTTQLSICALNSSKSAYVSFILVLEHFFSTYSFLPGTGRHGDLFSCQVLNKALLSVFKGRLNDTRLKDGALERCEVHLQDDGEQGQSRLVVKMICKHGVTKTYELTYEHVNPIHALFDKNTATNKWRIHSKLLREYIEYFGARTEQLDMYAENGRFTLTSYTEKISNGREILKQPLQTAVTIEVGDFDEFNVVDDLHVAVSVKDFRNMVIHSETLKTTVAAMYSVPASPLQFRYEAHGIRCEFTLMTIGDRGDVASSLSRATVRPHTTEGSIANARRQDGTGARAQEFLQRRFTRALASDNGAPTSSVSGMARADQDSLFVQQDEEDRQWEPSQFRAENEDAVGWNASGDFLLSGDALRGLRPKEPNGEALQQEELGENGIAPTQRASQIRGIFD